MTDKPINVRIPNNLRDRIDALRGDVKRETWIRRRLELDTARLENADRLNGTLDEIEAPRPIGDGPQHLPANLHSPTCRCGVCTLTKGKR